MAKQSDAPEAGYQLVQGNWQYRNREDITILPPNVLVVGSQNIVTNVSGRLQTVKGYTLDGQADITTFSPISSAYDFETSKGHRRNIRVYLDPATGLGVMQVRHKTGTTIAWDVLMDDLYSGILNFTEFYDYNSEKENVCLFVDGSNNVHEWNGAETAYASSNDTTNAIGIVSTDGALASVTATTTTVGNTFSFNGLTGADANGSFLMTANPTNGQTITYTIDGTAITITFVTVIGAVAGNVLIGATLRDTRNNLLGLLQAPTTTNATQVALSGLHATRVNMLDYAAADYSITKEGTTTWAEEGFYILKGSRKVLLAGVEYTYVGGESSTTIIVTTDPTGGTQVVGDFIAQVPVTNNANSFASFPSNFHPTLISNLNNQIYLGSSLYNSIYISKTNDYTDYAFANPRLVGTGMRWEIDGIPTAFVPQENKMYISSGKDYWYYTTATLSSDLANESLQFERLKTASLQAAKSQALVSKDKNNVIFVSNEPVLSTLGRVADNLVTPQLGDISYPIVIDFNAYDFTDGAVFYHKNFLYVSVPKMNLIRIYNQTDPSKQFWEAPVTYPIARFCVIDGELYGHSYQSPETFKLFDGYNFNGQPIGVLAAFAYTNYGTRYNSKGFSKVYVEGYIAQNVTELKLGIKKDIDGCSTGIVYNIDGTKRAITCIGGSKAPLGKEALGKKSFGSDMSEQVEVPVKFRVVKTMPISPYFYEVQFSFYSSEVDYHWELVAFGAKLISASDMSASITE